jgi:hypothetical protein
MGERTHGSPGEGVWEHLHRHCLLETNYNRLNKFVFAKQIIDKAFQGDIIPTEQFAKRGSQATEGVLTSGLFCDIAQALHKTAAIESVDLANCYDVVAHLIASIALQSFKVPKVMVAVMLYVLKTMIWYLKTAFGVVHTYVDQKVMPLTSS